MSSTTRTEEIDSGLWTKPRFEDLSAAAALLYIWSWSNSHVGLAGLYEVGRRTIARESKVPEDALDAALGELAACGWAFYERGVMWAPARVGRLKPRSKPMAIGVVKALDAIDVDHPLRARWLGRYGAAPWLQDAFDDERRDPHVVAHDRQLMVSRPSHDGHPTVTRPSGDVHEIPDSVGDSLNVTRPSPEGQPTFLKQEQEQRLNEDHQRGARATPAGVVDHHSLPSDFPEHLAARAERILVAVRAIQERVSPRSAPPTLYRIGLALRESPDVDHDALVHKLDGWAMDPRRLQARNRRELDVPGAWLEFCQRAQRDATGQDRPGSAAAAGRALVVSGRAVLEAQAQRRAAAAPSEGAAA